MTAPISTKERGLTDEERRALSVASFKGPRPANNVWSLLALPHTDGEIPGEVIEDLFKRGFYTVEPVTNPETINGFTNKTLGEIPDVELICRYRITPAGRRALSESGPGNG